MLWLAQLALASAIEVAFVGWRRTSIGHYRPSGLTRSKAADLFFSIMTTVGITDLWVNFTTLGIGYLLGLAGNRVLTLKFGFPALETGSPVIDGLLFYFLFSFFFYWNHRLLHTGPFWMLHRFHHSATEMSLFNAVRSHPLQEAMERLTMVWPMALTGVRPGIVFVVMLLHGVQQLLTHANIPSGWGWFGRWVFQSPLLHRVHHAEDIRQANRNFGALMIWDHIFGTYAAPVENIPIGVAGDIHNRQIFIIDLVRDTLDFVRSCTLPLRRLNSFL